MKRSTAIAGLLLAALLGSAALAASGEEGWSYDLWHDLMSPYCPGRTLADCPSEQAEKLRTWIVDQERSGRSREEVESQLLGIFGDMLRQAPVPRGMGLAAYVIPVVLFLAGGVLVTLFLRRQGRRAPETGAPRVAVVDPELERALDEELQRDAE